MPGVSNGTWEDTNGHKDTGATRVKEIFSDSYVNVYTNVLKDSARIYVGVISGLSRIGKWRNLLIRPQQFWQLWGEGLRFEGHTSKIITNEEVMKKKKKKNTRENLNGQSEFNNKWQQEPRNLKWSNGQYRKSWTRESHKAQLDLVIVYITQEQKGKKKKKRSFSMDGKHTDLNAGRDIRLHEDALHPRSASGSLDTKWISKTIKHKET